MQLGKRIDLRRKELGLTQMKLAQLSGVTQQAIEKQIRGDSLPGYNAIVALSLALEVSPAWFFDSETEEVTVVRKKRSHEEGKIKSDFSGCFSFVDLLIVDPYRNKEDLQLVLADADLLVALRMLLLELTDVTKTPQLEKAISFAQASISGARVFS